MAFLHKNTKMCIFPKWLYTYVHYYINKLVYYIDISLNYSYLKIKIKVIIISYLDNKFI